MKATALRSSSATSRTRGALSLVLILSAVLAVSALLAAVIAGNATTSAPAVPTIMPTAIILDPPATAGAIQPVISTATDEPPTPTAEPTATVATVAPTASETSLPAASDTPPPTPTAKPQPTATSQPQAAATYTVKRGDSCYAIAQRFNVSLNALIRENKLNSNCFIRAGQVLTIPAP